MSNVQQTIQCRIMCPTKQCTCLDLTFPVWWMNQNESEEQINQKQYLLDCEKYQYWLLKYLIGQPLSFTVGSNHHLKARTAQSTMPNTMKEPGICAFPPTHPPTHPLTHSLTHSPTHSLTHPLTHPLTHSLHSLTHSTSRNAASVLLS